MTPTRTRAEALVHEWKLRDNYETEEIDNIRLIQRITQALDAERQAAMEEAATVADEYNAFTGFGYCDELAPDYDHSQSHDYGRGWHQAKRAIADAIRQQAKASRELKDDAVS